MPEYRRWEQGSPLQEVKDEIEALLPRLRRFAWALTGSRDDGDDLVQAGCVKALASLAQFTPGTRLDAWMFRILRTIWIDRLRATRRRPTAHDPEAVAALSDGGAGARGAEARTDLGRVRSAMARLVPEQREVLAMVAVEGLSYREAAEALGVPVGTVMSRLARARARLAEEIDWKER